MLNWNFDILKLQKALGEHFSVIPAQFHTADHHQQSSPTSQPNGGRIWPAIATRHFHYQDNSCSPSSSFHLNKVWFSKSKMLLNDYFQDSQHYHSIILSSLSSCILSTYGENPPTLNLGGYQMYISQRTMSRYCNIFISH